MQIESPGWAGRCLVEKTHRREAPVPFNPKAWVRLAETLSLRARLHERNADCRSVVK